MAPSIATVHRLLLGQEWETARGSVRAIVAFCGQRHRTSGGRRGAWPGPGGGRRRGCPQPGFKRLGACWMPGFRGREYGGGSDFLPASTVRRVVCRSEVAWPRWLRIDPGTPRRVFPEPDRGDHRPSGYQSGRQPAGVGAHHPFAEATLGDATLGVRPTPDRPSPVLRVFSRRGFRPQPGRQCQAHGRIRAGRARGLIHRASRLQVTRMRCRDTSILPANVAP